MNYLTPEQRKISVAKSVATRKANIAKRKAEEAAYKEYAQKLKFGIIELEGQLDRLREAVKQEVNFGEAIKKLTSGVLLREHEIVEHAVPATTAVGVYFLIQDKRIVYVGQSTNVFSRIFTHIGSKKFDSYVYIPCEKEKLDKLESLYIHFLSPPLNGNTPAGNKLAPLTLDSLLK